MAYLVPTVVHSSGSAFLGRVAAFTVAPVIRFARALRNRSEVRKLADFDDHMLRDIGLTRGDLDGALGEPLHFDPSVLLVQSFEHRHRSQPLVETSRARRPQVPLVQAPLHQVPLVNMRRHA